MIENIKIQVKKKEDKYWYLNIVKRLLLMKQESIIKKEYDPIIKNLAIWYKNSQI